MTKLDQFFQWALKQNLAAPFVRLTTRTYPKLRAAGKAAHPEGVERTATRLCQIGASYENIVKNKTGDETFVAEELWSGNGRHVKNNRYLVQHVKTGKLYIAFKPRETKDGAVMIPEDKWVDVATKAVISRPIDGFLAQSSPSKTGVPWRTVALENILAIDCGATFNYGEK